jgi:hypothetical protein
MLMPAGSHTTPAGVIFFMTFDCCTPAMPRGRSFAMPPITAQLIFTVLGPVFLILGAWRCIGAARVVPQARAWLIVGLIFSAVAVYLWWSQATPPH